jgi:hypothetical protein
MCCGVKNRPLALFGACLAIFGGTMAALISSHARDPVPQVTPEPGESAPDRQRPIGETEKHVDVPQKRSTERATITDTAKPAPTR